MKKTFTLIITLLILRGFAGYSQKIGYAEIDKVIVLMPEYEQAKAKLEGEYKDIQKQLEEMQVEFNNKYKAYTDNMNLPDNDPKKWSPSVRQLKEKELQDIQIRMQDFQASVSQQLQQRQLELMEPINKKIQGVIDQIMQEKGYLFVILDLTAVQVNKAKCEDITPLIKQKLNIQ